MLLHKRNFKSCRFPYSGSWKVSESMLVTTAFLFCLRDLFHSAGLIALEYLLSIKSKVRTVRH